MTLNEILSDMLLTIRGAKVVQSEPITRQQLLFHLNNYRAMLIAQDIAKYNPIDRIHIQALSCLSLSTVDKSDCPSLHNLCKYFLRTDVLPKPVSTVKGNLFSFIGSVHGEPWQLTNEEDIHFLRSRKYTGRDVYVFYKDYRLYILSNKALDYVTIRGVFEDPTDLSNYTNNCTQMANFTYDSDYPLSNRWYPLVKDFILTKELKIMVEAPSDSKNDSLHGVSANVEK